MKRYLRSRVALSEELLMKFNVLTVSVPTASSAECFVASWHFALELQVLNEIIVVLCRF